MIEAPDSQLLYAAGPIWLAWTAATAPLLASRVDSRRVISALLLLIAPAAVLRPATHYLPVLLVAALLAALYSWSVSRSRDHSLSVYFVALGAVACLAILTLATTASDLSLAIAESLRQPFYTASVYGVSLVFSVAFGAEIVRRLLDQTGVATPECTTAGLGRAIGQLERAVLTVVIMLGSYEALGFLVAAKGLVRSAEMRDDHSFAEYFLIGTLASVSVALSAALTAKWLLSLTT